MNRQGRATLIAGEIESAQKDDGRAARARPPRVKGERRGPSGKIDAKDAAKVFRRFEGAMKKCYERGLKKRPGIQGKVLLVVRVGSDGKVTQATARGRSLDDKVVQNCMESMAKRMEFPEPKGGVAQLKKPYNFKPDF